MSSQDDSSGSSIHTANKQDDSSSNCTHTANKLLRPTLAAAGALPLPGSPARRTALRAVIFCNGGEVGGCRLCRGSPRHAEGGGVGDLAHAIGIGVRLKLQARRGASAHGHRRRLEQSMLTVHQQS